jgi:hypothetical protein
LPVSLKAGNGNTFANFGISSLFFKHENGSYSINETSYFYNIGKELGIDFSLVCLGVGAYEQKIPFAKRIISRDIVGGGDFLQQAWGMNYFYYMMGKQPFEIDRQFLQDASRSFRVVSVQYPYYASDRESSKATVIKAEDSKHRYSIVIKNKNGDIHPRSVLVNLR